MNLAVFFLLSAQAPPTLPDVPRTIPFDAERAARRLLFAQYERAQSRAGYGYTLRWSEDGQTGTETFVLQPEAGQIALSTETGTTGQRQVRRAIGDGDSLLGVNFAERRTQPVREFTRVSLAKAGGIARALAYVGVQPVGRAAQGALADRFTLRSRVWRNPDGTVGEEDTSRPNLRFVRRYAFGADQSLTRCEEWSITTRRTTYRREDYSPAPKITAETFSQSLPASYTEVPLRRQPDPPRRAKVAEIAPAARDLHHRWQRAMDKLLTLTFDAQIAVSAPLRTNESNERRTRTTNYSGAYRLWLYRPGKVRVDYQTTAGTTRGDRAWTAVADGVQVKCQRTTRLNTPDDLWNGLTRSGMRDNTGTLSWLLDELPNLDDWDSVTHGGTGYTVDGAEVQTLVLTRTTDDDDNGRTMQTTTTLRVGIAKDGLPRQIESVRKTDIRGAFERDQPPIITTRIVYQNVKVDLPPSLSRFVVR